MNGIPDLVIHYLSKPILENIIPFIKFQLNMIGIDQFPMIDIHTVPKTIDVGGYSPESYITENPKMENFVLHQARIIY